jgi:hypothetical protein
MKKHLDDFSQVKKKKARLLKLMSATTSGIFAFHSVGTGGVSSAVKGPKMEAEHSLLSRAEIKGEWSYTICVMTGRKLCRNLQ